MAARRWWTPERIRDLRIVIDSGATHRQARDILVEQWGDAQLTVEAITQQCHRWGIRSSAPILGRPRKGSPTEYVAPVVLAPTVDEEKSA